MRKIICFTMVLALSTNSCFSQTGCRRNSDGVLFQSQILFSSDYNANSPCCNVANYCLPYGNSGTPCRIRHPLTLVVYDGTFGSYSAINCPLDNQFPLALMAILLIIVWRKPYFEYFGKKYAKYKT